MSKCLLNLLSGFLLMSAFHVGIALSADGKEEVKASPPKETAAEAPKKKETTDQEDALNEFKEAKFLQIDKLDVPKELKRIEEQLRQNALDVIISSKTHTPVYAQKIDDGYTDSYKKFFGLDIQIVPIPKEQDFYSLTFFYYNWTNRKFDKRLRRRISKYNVLNEMRFGLYELLLGKKFVDDHKDEIEKQNFDRIQAVREGEEKEARSERQKKKLEKKKKEEEELKLALKEENRKEKLRRGEEEKKDKKGPQDKSGEDAMKGAAAQSSEQESDDVKPEDSESAIKSKDKNELEKDKKKKKPPTSRDSKDSKEEGAAALSSNPDVPENGGGSSIPMKSSLYAFGNFFNENVVTDGILHATTNLKYLGMGARYVAEQEIAQPRGMRFSLKVGMPIKKDDYAFPVYRSFETEVYQRKIFGHFKVLAGLDFTPIYFVNLPNAGEGLKVFENDFFWLKGGLGYTQEFLGKEFDVRFLLFKSLVSKSNQEKKLSGNAMNLSVHCQWTEKHGGEVAFQKTELLGDLTVSSQNLLLSYVYKFEN